MNVYNFSDIHQHVSRILDKSDRVFLEGLRKDNIISSKLDINAYADIVSEYDRRIEDILVDELAKVYPEIGFITEEATDRNKKKWNWIIDPIDGTFNFVHGVQTCGTSISLWHENDPYYGVMSFPAMTERAHAIKGEGIYSNNVRLPSQHTRITPMPSPLFSSLAQMENLLTMFQEIARLVSYPRTFASSVYHIYLTTTHKADLTVIVNNEIWDIANAELFAHEAGLYIEYPWIKPDVHDVRREYDQAVILGEEELVKKISERFKQLYSNSRDLI